MDTEEEEVQELRDLVEKEEDINKDLLGKIYGFEAENYEEEYSRLLHRFCRARKKEPDKALKFLKEDAAWRQNQDCVALRLESPAAVLGCSPGLVGEYYERRLLGLDKIGRPVYYQNYRNLIVRKLMTLCSLDTLERYHIWEQERAIALVDEINRNDAKHPGTMCVILDVSGMTLRRHINSDFLKFIKSVASIDQDHFPERMGITMILNAPRAFGVVWSVVRPWLDPKTAEKIKIFSNDAYDAIQEILGQNIAQAIVQDHSKDDFSSHGPNTNLEDPKQLARRLRTEAGFFDNKENTEEKRIEERITELPVRISFYGTEDDEFHEAISPRPNDDDLARQLWIAPITIGKWQLAANVDEAADRLERLVAISFICVLGLLATAFVAMRSESRRAPFLAIVTSLASFPIGLLAIAGCRCRNPDLLSAHVVAQIPTTLVFLGLGLASLVMSAQGSADTFFVRSGGDTKIRSQYLALGTVGLIACFLLAAQIILSSKLAARIKHALFTPFPDWEREYAPTNHQNHDLETGRQPSLPKIHRGIKSPVYAQDGKNESIMSSQKHNLLSGLLRQMKDAKNRNDRQTRNVDVAVRQSRLALSSCSILMAGVGIAGIAYGAASTSYFVRRDIGGAALAPYLLIHSCVSLLVISLLGIGIASTQQDPQSLHERVTQENLLSRVFDVDPRADRLRFLVKRDARLLVEMRIYKCLVIANLALCLICICIALAQIFSVGNVVKRDGDNRPQVARTASLALLLVVAMALLACGTIWISVHSLNALFLVQKQRRRLRCRQLDFELRKRARRTIEPGQHRIFSPDASRPTMVSSTDNTALPNSIRSSRTAAFFAKLTKPTRIRQSFRPKTIDDVFRKRRNSRGSDIGEDLFHDAQTDENQSNNEIVHQDEFQLSTADEELMKDTNPPLASGFAHLSRNDKVAILFGMIYGLGQIFFDGTYAIFNVLVRNHGQNGRRRVPWFMALWRFYGNIDKRYHRSDNLIVVLNALSALILGPLCLVFVWMTYETRPARHLFGVVATALQLWTFIISFTTEARAGFRDCAPIDDFAVFWLGFVGLSIVRFLIPLPILYNAASSIIEDATLAQRWRAILDTDAFHLDQARRYFSSENTVYTTLPTNEASPPKEDDDDELQAYATPTNEHDPMILRRITSEPCFIMGIH